MVVIFGYIFGSAISVPSGGSYRAWTALLLAVFVPLCTARYARLS